MLSKRILTLVFVVAFLTLLVGCLPTPTPPNEVPIITSSPITTATVGMLYAYDVNATDPEGDTLTYSLITKPTGMTINSANGLIKWTPTAKGDNPVTVKVSDGTLSVIQNFTIKVGTLPAVNQAPVIISTPITTATVGVTYFYDVNATDPDGDTLTYFLTACPGGMTISSASGLIMWTPTVKGNYAVVVNVSDGVLSDAQPFTIVVSKPTVPPETYTITASAGPGGTISPLGDVTVNKGANIVFTITPNTNYNIADVLVDGGSVGAVSSYTFNNVSKDHTIHATFSAVEPEPEPAVPEIITVRWLEDSVRFYPDGSVWYTAQNDLIPPEVPATLIHINGDYHFADVNDFYNCELPDIAGIIVIDETGQLSGDTTYTSLASLLPIEEHIEGNVEIITGEEVETITYIDENEATQIIIGHDGIMVGTYTQWAYAFGTEEDVHNGYEWATLCEGSEDKWFVGRTEYIAHGGL